MAVKKPRSRNLIFRLTPDEYTALRAASSKHGARSLSEFARAKLLETINQPPLDVQLSELRMSVARLAKLLEKN